MRQSQQPYQHSQHEPVKCPFIMLDLFLSATFDIVDFQSRHTVFCPREVVSVRTSRSRDLPKVSSRSRLGQLGQRLGLGLRLEGLVHIPTGQSPTSSLVMLHNKLANLFV
jgi:hypothetical protein